MTIAIPPALVSIWQESAERMSLHSLRKEGILPILSHLWLEGSNEAMLLGAPARCSGQAALAHTCNTHGEVERLLLDFRVDLFGTRGRLVGPQPEDAGQEALVGRIYARHVFTKPFAPASERKVLRFTHPKLPELPAARAEWLDIGQMLPIGSEEEALDPSPTPELTPIHFALHHCDSNQHVNSLVYPRLFEDAAQSRLAKLRPDARLLSRQVAVAFRKPFFAGQSAQLELQSYTHSSHMTVRGSFRSFAEPVTSATKRAHTQLAMRFR